MTSKSSQSRYGINSRYSESTSSRTSRSNADMVHSSYARLVEKIQRVEDENKNLVKLVESLKGENEKVETEKMLVEKERDELFDECDMLRNQVEELTNKNKLNTKRRIKSSSELLQENEEVKRSETSANWKQLAEQTGMPDQLIEQLFTKLAPFLSLLLSTKPAEKIQKTEVKPLEDKTAEEEDLKYSDFSGKMNCKQQKIDEMKPKMGVKVAEDVETNIKKQVESESESEDVFHETEERPIKSRQSSRFKNRGWSSTEIDNVTRYTNGGKMSVKAETQKRCVNVVVEGDDVSNRNSFYANNYFVGEGYQENENHQNKDDEVYYTEENCDETCNDQEEAIRLLDQSYSHSSDMDAFKNYATLEEINLCQNNMMQRGNQKTESLPVGMFLQQDSMMREFDNFAVEDDNCSEDNFVCPQQKFMMHKASQETSKVTCYNPETGAKQQFSKFDNYNDNLQNRRTLAENCERAPLKPQSDFYKREIPFDYHRSGSFDFNIIPINKAVCPNLNGGSPSARITKPLAPLRGSTSSKSIVGIMKSKFSRASKEKSKDASKEFTSKKVPASSGYVKSKPPMGSKVKLTSCKPLQQEKLYQEDKSLVENRVAEATQDVEALSDEGFGESSTIERMEKDGTLTQNSVSPKKKQDDDKYVDGLSSSARINGEIPDTSKPTTKVGKVKVIKKQSLCSKLSSPAKLQQKQHGNKSIAVLNHRKVPLVERQHSIDASRLVSMQKEKQATVLSKTKGIQLHSPRGLIKPIESPSKSIKPKQQLIRQYSTPVNVAADDKNNRNSKKPLFTYNRFPSSSAIPLNSNQSLRSPNSRLSSSPRTPNQGYNEFHGSQYRRSSMSPGEQTKKNPSTYNKSSKTKKQQSCLSPPTRISRLKKLNRT